MVKDKREHSPPTPSSLPQPFAVHAPLHLLRAYFTAFNSFFGTLKTCRYRKKLFSLKLTLKWIQVGMV